MRSRQNVEIVQGAPVSECGEGKKSEEIAAGCGVWSYFESYHCSGDMKVQETPFSFRIVQSTLFSIPSGVAEVTCIDRDVHCLIDVSRRKSLSQENYLFET